MMTPPGGPRDRQGSFCTPNERTGGDSNGAKDGAEGRQEQKTLEDINSSAHIPDSQISNLDSPLTFSTTTTTTRVELSNIPTRSMNSAAAFDMSSQTISRSTTPSILPTHPEPPVTKSTLAELDVPRIVQNPKLRHDVNFDPDLHFRPNLDGEKGKKKLMKASHFWEVLKQQLQAFMEDPVKFESEHPDTKWCLPSTLRAIGDILETLVPPEDRLAVSEIMNVELLMQQFAKGVADLESLAAWLAKTLKMHCAPMRDDWVNEMVTQLSTGNQNRDVGLLAAGLQTLMGVLEAMKLDVANHQIRCLRPLLIQDTVDFEQTFFMKKVAAGKIDISFAHMWYLRGLSPSQSEMSPLPGTPGDIWAFFRGFTNCLLPKNSSDRVPETFMFDEERILKLRSDMVDAINMEVCIRLFRKVYVDAQAQYGQQRRSQTFEPEVQCQPRGFNPSISSTPSGSDNNEQRSPIQSTVELPAYNSRIQENNKATIRGRFRRSALDEQVFEPYDSSSSACSSSGFGTPLSSRSSSPLSFQDPSTTHFPAQFQPQRIQTTLPSASQEASLISDINAILADASTSAVNGAQTPSHQHRWSLAAQDLALSILHATSHQLMNYSTILPHLEQTLSAALSDPSSFLFAAAEESLLSSLSPLLSHLVCQFSVFNNAKLFEISVLPKGRIGLDKLMSEGTRMLGNTEGAEEKRRVMGREEVREIVRSMAHVGTLHWRVWSPLVYLVNPDAEIQDDQPMEVELTIREAPQSAAAVLKDAEKEERDRALKERGRRRTSREKRRSWREMR